MLASDKPFVDPDNELDTTMITLKGKGNQEQLEVYLCFRPYILEMLIELYPDFELVLFTVGSMEYAHAFCKALYQLYWKSKF